MSALSNISGYDIIAFALWGADVLLFFQCMCKSYFVFPHKNRKFYMLLVSGLIGGIIFATTTIITSYFLVGNVPVSIFGLVAWFVMIVNCYFVYSIRIQSMGGYNRFDKFAAKIPWIFIIVTLPIFLIVVVTYFLVNDQAKEILKEVSLVLGIIFSVLITVSEAFLYLVLLQKVREILEYRTTAKKKLVWELSFALVLIVILDVLLIISKVAIVSLDKNLRPFTYLLRFVYIVRFYDDLLEDVNQSYLSNISRHDSYHIESKSLEYLEE
eukprot:NODE_224_length_12322_cov_0.795549.p3 type:complete len:269 gc:universal NODE_224_length_12322_cov_0.795549:4300-5106(+)